MALPYWTQSDLEDRIGAEATLSFLDDANVGTVSSGPLARLQADCDSYVEGYLRGIYDLDAVRDAPPNQVVRLSLDKAVVELAKRHPEYVRRDWAEMEAMLRQELADVRTGKIRLDVVGSPEPAANEGGTLMTPGATSGSGLIEAPDLVFGGPCSMGDF
jgi:phage gp36-like protein